MSLLYAQPYRNILKMMKICRSCLNAFIVDSLIINDTGSYLKPCIYRYY